MTTFVAHTRARDDRQFQRAAAQTDLREAPGGAAAAGRTMVRSPACAVEIFVLANLVGTTMELRRSMMMMRGRRSSAASYGVIDNRSEILQH